MARYFEQKITDEMLSSVFNKYHIIEKNLNDEKATYVCTEHCESTWMWRKLNFGAACEAS